MTPQKLDFIFPFIVFFYGLVTVFVLEVPFLARLGHEKMNLAYTNLTKHKNLAWVCFFTGGIWAAQNVWYSSL
jgi:hypothetical protein